MSNQPTGGRARQHFKPTKITNLKVEVGTGIFYLLAKVNGAGYRYSLHTTDLEVAKERLAKKMSELRAAAPKNGEHRSAAKFDDAALLRLFVLQTVPQLMKQISRLNKNLERLKGENRTAGPGSGRSANR